MKMKSLTIGRLARQAGVNLETVRYYERRGPTAETAAERNRLQAFSGGGGAAA